MNMFHYLDRLCWENLSRNPAVVKILEKNISKVNFNELALNPAREAIIMLFENTIEINLILFQRNPAFITARRKLTGVIDWYKLTHEPGELEYIFDYDKSKIDILFAVGIELKLNYSSLCLSTTTSEYFLRKSIPRLDWSNLSANPSIAAINVLRDYPDKIDFKNISTNRRINELFYWDTGRDALGNLIDDYFNFKEIYTFLRRFLLKEIVLDILRRVHL